MKNKKDELINLDPKKISKQLNIMQANLAFIRQIQSAK